jgi:hypothetical protein
MRVHVGDASGYCVKCFECAHERTGRKNLDFNASSCRGTNRLRKANRTGVKTWRTVGPVGHHLQLPNSLRNRGAGKLKVVPAANDPTLAKISRRLIRFPRPIAEPPFFWLS